MLRLRIVLQRSVGFGDDDLDDIYGDIGTYRPAQGSFSTAASGPAPAAAPASSGAGIAAGLGSVPGGAYSAQPGMAGGAGAGDGGAQDEQQLMSALVDQASSDWQR